MYVFVSWLPLLAAGRLLSYTTKPNRGWSKNFGAWGVLQHSAETVVWRHHFESVKTEQKMLLMDSLVPRPSHRRNNELLALSCSFCPKCWNFERLRSKKCTHSCFKTKNACTKCDRGPLPPPVHLGRQNVIFVIKWNRLPSPFFHTASDQKLDSGKAWEWGYLMGSNWL